MKLKNALPITAILLAGLMSSGEKDMENKSFDQLSNSETKTSFNHNKLYTGSTDLLLPTDVTISGNSTDVWIFQVAGTTNMSPAREVCYVQNP